MKELKYKEVDKTLYREPNGDGLLIKPFYTLAEKRAIVDNMKAPMQVLNEKGKVKSTRQKDALDREFSKVVLTANFLTNIDTDGMSDNDVYDLCSENGLIYDFEDIVDGYIEIDKLIERDESVYKSFEMLLDGINDKLKGFDMNKIQEGFVGLKEGLSDGKSV